MERLTKIDGCGQRDLIRCFDCGSEKAGENLENCGYCSEGWQKAINRLAAYEDTGLEPEEIKKAFNEDALLKMTAQYLDTTPDRLQDWDRGMTEKLASAELQCKQVNEGAAILMKRLSDALEELEQAQKRIAELEGKYAAD